MATDQTQAQLAEYYKINVSQLRWSFGSSLAALFSGLAALLAGVGLVLSGSTGLTSQIILLAGVFTEFVGAGFFVLYSQNIKQLNVFYDKLIKHQDTLYAISLANHVGDTEKSNAMLAVIGNLLSRGEPTIPPDALKEFATRKNG